MALDPDFWNPFAPGMGFGSGGGGVGFDIGGPGGPMLPGIERGQCGPLGCLQNPFAPGPGSINIGGPGGSGGGSPTITIGGSGGGARVQQTGLGSVAAGILGLSFGRIAAFVIGLILIMGGILLMIRHSTVVKTIVVAGKKAIKTASEAGTE